MKAVIIEDEQKSRDMLADILKKNFPQITILGLAKNVAEGVALIQTLKPNLLEITRLPLKMVFSSKAWIM